MDDHTKPEPITDHCIKCNTEVTFPWSAVAVHEYGYWLHELGMLCGSCYKKEKEARHG